MFATERLSIRRYAPEDIAGHLRLRADPLVRRFMHWAQDEAALPARIREAARRHPLDGRGWLNFGVARRADGALIGDHALRVEAREAFLGLALLPEARRCGYGGELVRGAMRWLAAHGVSRCVAEIDFGNAPSFALFHGLGFDVIAEQRDAFGPFAVLARALR